MGHEHSHSDHAGHAHAHGDHGHDHAEPHGHERSPPTVKRPDAETEKRQSNRLFIVLLMIAAFFVVELIGARLAHSDVLEADAFHLLMDVLALAISLGALKVSSRKPTARFTFGLRRAEPLAALANGILVLGVAVELVRDGIEHLRAEHTTTPRSELMLIVATAALVVNGLNAWLLHGAMHGGHGHAHHGHAHHGHAHDHSHDGELHDHDHTAHGKVEHGNQLNMRGAWLHLLGDALGSMAAFTAGLAIRFGASPLVDPVASFVVVAILVIGAVRLLRDATLVLFEAAPPHLGIEKVRRAILGIEGVAEVHALHVWTLGTGHDAITAHVRPKKGSSTNLGPSVAEALRKRFEIEYVTIQVDAE